MKRYQWATQAIAMFVLVASSLLAGCTTDTLDQLKVSEYYRIGAWSDVPRLLDSCANKTGKDAPDLYTPNACMTSEYRAILQNPMPEQELRTQMLNKTSIAYSSLHGTQVSYNDASGSNFLWYPASNKVLSGQWRFVNLAQVTGRVQTEGETNQPPPKDVFCVKYEPDTTTSSTGEVNVTWNCGLATEFVRHGRQELLDGDVFGLGKGGTVPFVMETGTRYNSAQLLSQTRRSQ